MGPGKRYDEQPEGPVLELPATESLYEAIVQSADDAIFTKSLDGTIASWNAGAERLYGYTAHEIIGKKVGILAPPDQPDEIPALLARIAAGEQIHHFETVRARRDGSLVDVSLTISPDPRRQRADPGGIVGRPRHQRAEDDRSGAAPGAEAGVDRAACGRHRPRLQQHDVRDPRVRRHAGRGSRAREPAVLRSRSGARQRRDDQCGRRARVRPDRPVAGLRPPPAGEPPADRPERFGRGHRADAPSADRGRHQVDGDHGSQRSAPSWSTPASSTRSSSTSSSTRETRSPMAARSPSPRAA